MEDYNSIDIKCNDLECYNCNNEKNIYCTKCLDIYLNSVSLETITEIYSDLMSVFNNEIYLKEILDVLNINHVDVSTNSIKIYKDKLFNYINNKLLKSNFHKENLPKDFKFCLKSINYAIENMTIEELYDIYDEATKKLSNIKNMSNHDKILAEESKEKLFNIINIIMLKNTIKGL